MHGLSGTDIKLKDADAASDSRLTGKKRVRTGQRQLRGNASTRTQVCHVDVFVVEGSDASTANASLERSCR